MKYSLLPVLFMVLLLEVSGEEVPYRTALDSIHERYRLLDEQRSDYRKPEPSLPAEQENEYLRLAGELLINDPVWTLGKQLQADIDAIVAVRTRTPEESAALESLKEFMAITAAFERRATTRKEANQFATDLRQFHCSARCQRCQIVGKSNDGVSHLISGIC